jgi:hypothetical protein
MKCEAGGCSAECGGRRGCGCWASSDEPDDCGCACYGRASVIVKGGKRIAFKTWKPKIKPTTQTKYNICTHDLPITGLAELLDKFLPNKILVPASRLNRKVTLSLKKNTLRQIISASGLVLSIPAEGPVKKSKKR